MLGGRESAPRSDAFGRAHGSPHSISATTVRPRCDQKTKHVSGGGEDDEKGKGRRNRTSGDRGRYGRVHGPCSSCCTLKSATEGTRTPKYLQSLPLPSPFEACCTRITVDVAICCPKKKKCLKQKKRTLSPPSLSETHARALCNNKTRPHAQDVQKMVTPPPSSSFSRLFTHKTHPKILSTERRKIGI